MSDDQAQSDEQLIASEEDVSSIAAREMAKSIWVSCPAIVRRFDPAKQTVDAQPSVKRNFTGLGLVELPVCLDVPLALPAGGHHALTFPIAVGDECWLVFADRAIDNWWSKGGMQEPHEVRFHDPSDCVAVMGVSSQARVMSPAISTGATELRTRDGALIFRFEDTKISLGVKNVQPVPCGTDLVKVLTDLLNAILKLTVPTGMGPSGVPINSPDFSAVLDAAGKILSSTVVVQKNP